MKVTHDSIRLYIDNTAPAKGATKGGFAIGGIDGSKAPNARYMNISTDGGSTAGYNTFLGYKSGGPGSGGLYNIAIGSYAGYNLNLASTIAGRNNIFIGDSAGLINNSGYQNVFIGKNAGATASAGYHNVYIGYRSGSEGHGQYNTFIGNESGRKNNNGFGNVFVGDQAGKGIVDGDQNVLIGSQTGWKLNNGNQNVLIGTGNGFNAIDAQKNTIIGTYAGNSLIAGINNVFIGHSAGYFTEGNNNIFIGREAGKNVTSATGRLVIDNTYRSTIDDHFITGDIQGYKLRFNTSVGIWTNPDPSNTLTVSGSVLATAYNTSSDMRLKENIETISDPLQKVVALRGVSFNWRDTANIGSGRHLGFIAQEVEKIVPEVVKANGTYYTMEYAPLTAILVEAIKELKKENDELKVKVKKIDELQEQIDALKALVIPAGNK